MAGRVEIKIPMNSVIMIHSGRSDILRDGLDGAEPDAPRPWREMHDIDTMLDIKAEQHFKHEQIRQTTCDKQKGLHHLAHWMHPHADELGNGSRKCGTCRQKSAKPHESRFAVRATELVGLVQNQTGKAGGQWMSWLEWLPHSEDAILGSLHNPLLAIGRRA